jgi:hypothetical protein
MLLGIVLSSTFIIAETNITEEVSSVLEDVSEDPVTQNAKGYVEDFVRQKGINADEINSVNQLDLNNLPKDVSIENVDDTNLAIYQIAYEDFAKELFVVTYSTDELVSYKNLIFKQDERQLLHFGINSLKKDAFLETASGISSDINQGYAMMREGSITGLSTSLNVEKTNTERLEIIIYINEKPFYFRNMIDTTKTGKHTAYSLQSSGVVTFLPGDTISVYASGANGATIKNILTTLEITTLG